MNSAITAHNLSIKKGKSLVLEHLSVVIPHGQLTGLIGPSGSGKTTLMRAIVGVQKYNGELSVLGEKAGDAWLRKKIGYVTQTPAVYGDLTVGQNLKYFARIARADDKAVGEVIAKVHLGKQRKQLVDTLSGGQRARVSLAVALLGSPDVLVLDEPTVGLDPILREELWDMFQQLADEGKTLLISSHVMDEAERCPNLILLRDGKIIWNDTRRKLLTHTKTHDVGEAFIHAIKEAK